MVLAVGIACWLQGGDDGGLWVSLFLSWKQILLSDQTCYSPASQQCFPFCNIGTHIHCPSEISQIRCTTKVYYITVWSKAGPKTSTNSSSPSLHLFLSPSLHLSLSSSVRAQFHNPLQTIPSASQTLFNTSDRCGDLIH